MPIIEHDDEKKERMKNIEFVRSGMRHIENAKESRERKDQFAELGICSKCSHMHGEITKYGTKRHVCWALSSPRQLSPNDPLVVCTDYNEVGTMPLSMLLQLAIPIEPGQVHRQAGFIVDGEDYLIAEYGGDDYSL